jgi:hypothetical protein
MLGDVPLRESSRYSTHMLSAIKLALMRRRLRFVRCSWVSAQLSDSPHLLQVRTPWHSSWKCVKRRIKWHVPVSLEKRLGESA